MGDSLSFEVVLKILRKNTFMILTLTLLAGFFMALVTFLLLTPKYEAETQILVSQPENTGTVNNQDIETSLQLIMTYRDIILSPIILEEVINNLELNIPIRDLSEQITVSNEVESQVISVTVTDDSIGDAIVIADEIAGVFQEQVIEIMDVDNVSVLAPANLEADTSPVAPDSFINITLGLVVGLMAGVTLAFGRAFFDKSVRNEEDVSKHLSIPVIGSIDKIEN